MISTAEGGGAVLNWEPKLGILGYDHRVRGFVLDNVPRHRACGHGQRRRQIHLARPAASRKISVLRADHDLVGTRRYSRPGIDARATTRLDHARTRLLENLDIALAF